MAYNPFDHPRNPKGTPQGGQFTTKPGVGVDDDLTPTPGDTMVAISDLEHQIMPYRLPYGVWEDEETDNSSVQQSFAWLISQPNHLSQEEAEQWVSDHTSNMYQYLALQEMKHRYNIAYIDPETLSRVAENLQADIENEDYIVESLDDVEARASFLLYEELNTTLQQENEKRALPDPYEADLRGGFMLIDEHNDNALRYASVTPIFMTQEGADRVAEVGYEQAYAESALPQYLAS